MPAQTEQSEQSQLRRPRRRWWVRLIKWVAIAFVALVLLIVLVVGAAVWILTPERLTPLVEHYASEYIDGRVKAKRIELTFWKTFPRLNVDVDSLEVISGSLRGLTPDQQARLPQGADSLLSVAGFHADVNILRLFTGTIALHDITIDSPRVNIVDVSPTVSNYNIFPKSEETDSTSTPIPDIILSRFAITGRAPIHYVSLADSVEFKLNLTNTTLSGDDAPGYRLDFAADASSQLGDMTFDNLRIGMGGDIVWNHKKPYRIELSDFQAGINDVNTVVNTVVDFERDLTIESLLFRMPLVDVNSLIRLVPPQLRGELGKIVNNLRVGLTARLTQSYIPSVERYPSMELQITVPEGKVSYQKLKLSALALDLDARIDGKNLNNSRFDLKRLYANGEGIAFTLKAVLTDLIRDPKIEGTFEGGVDLGRLPMNLIAPELGAKVTGRLKADASFAGRRSYLTRENFHRLNVNGEASLSDFRFDMPDMPVEAFVRHAGLKLGSNSSVNGADSLLTVSFSIDTVSVAMPGLEAQARAFKIGIGSRNVASSVDTTQINPIGARATLGFARLKLVDDSTSIRLRDIDLTGVLRRFRNEARVPQFDMKFTARRMRYSDRLNRASLREADIAATVHPTPPRQPSQRLLRAMDSVAAVNPGLPSDSVRVLARAALRRNRRHNAADNSTSRVDFELDGETRSLLRKWRTSGHIKAKRARVMTPYFPLKNVVKDLDMTFSNDSIEITNTRYRVGHSEFVIDGSITNLTRALTSRSGRQPLRINMRVSADTIDVNEIAAAVFAGAAFAQKERQGLAGPISDSDNDDVVEASIAQNTDVSEKAAVLIPTNIEASVRLAGRNVLYSDLTFHNFRGQAEIFDGALNLRNLSARTDVGAVDLTALYQGLHPDSLSFAFGMQVRDFRLSRFMQLVPQLDTIMPLLRDVKGIVNAEVAATADVDTMMDIRIPSLTAAVNITGDSLVLLDAATYRKIGKWMLFKHKDRNVIDHLNARMVVKDAQMELYPFIFDIDRYKLGIFGSNDLDLNFKYHIAVLKSPIPFKFGINVSGNPDKMKIRLGGAKIKENSPMVSAISDTTRINLVNQIQDIFRRGVRRAGQSGRLRFDPGASPAPSRSDSDLGDTISHADSLEFIRQGLIPAPPAPDSTAIKAADAKAKKKKKK